MAFKADTNPFDTVVFDEKFWETYLELRPSYSEEFYKLIFAFHHEHGNDEWVIAHDVGAGPGIVAAVLAKRFKHVVVSDPSAAHVLAAQHQLSDLPANKLSFVHSPAEKIASQPDVHTGMTDFITVAEAIYLIDLEAGIPAFLKLLRPGGTLAVWLYGNPIFTEEPYAQKCQELHDNIANLCFSQIRPMRGTVFERASQRLFSWGDDIELPTADWAHVKRYKWNHDRRLCFHSVEACDSEPRILNKVLNTDEVVNKIDRAWWQKEWDFDNIKRWFEHELPNWRAADYPRDPDVLKWFAELKEAMGGKDVKRKATFPVVLVLATKR